MYPLSYFVSIIEVYPLLESGIFIITVSPDKVCVGHLLRRNCSPVFASMAGFVLFAVFIFIMAASNINSSKSDFFWPLILRGVGLGLVFIPLTTITLSHLEVKYMPAGTALTNMIRQIGGSVSIAIITTFIDFRTKIHYNNLIGYITNNNNLAIERLKLYYNFFISRGSTVAEATNRSYAAMKGTITKQALLLTYNDAFYIIGIFFIICIPFLLAFKSRNKQKNNVSIQGLE